MERAKTLRPWQEKFSYPEIACPECCCGALVWLPSMPRETRRSRWIAPTCFLSRHPKSKERKRFFFEKKKQKTFISYGYSTTSSVTTVKPESTEGPKIVEMATSVASRPLAIKIRPMRGMLWRASKVYQRPPR